MLGNGTHHEVERPLPVRVEQLELRADEADRHREHDRATLARIERKVSRRWTTSQVITVITVIAGSVVSILAALGKG